MAPLIATLPQAFEDVGLKMEVLSGGEGVAPRIGLWPFATLGGLAMPLVQCLTQLMET